MMDECNHQLNAVSTYPFFTIPRWNAKRPADKDCPYKDDTVVGNDVWISEKDLPEDRINLVLSRL